MNARTMLCTLAASVAVALPPAAGAAPSDSPKPSFAPMTYFVGIWNCKHIKNPDPSLVGTTFSFEGATDRNGYWEVLDFHDGRINISRDAAAGRWTFLYLGNGGDYTVMTTPGWSGKTMVLKDVLTYGNAPLGEARFTQINAGKYRATYSVRAPSGVRYYETECTRV